jgi:hypothetical protein
MKAILSEIVTSLQLIDVPRIGERPSLHRTLVCSCLAEVPLQPRTVPPMVGTVCDGLC